jgi:feruloyl esterase
MQEAFEAMASGRPRSAAAWAELARAAAPPGTRAWPRLAIWQGEADGTVRPVNAREMAKQWAALHGLDPTRPTEQGPLGPTGPASAGQRQLWRDAAGRPVLEVNGVAGMDHGVPINPGIGPDRGGRTMPFILDAGIPGPQRALEFLGLAGAAEAAFRVPQGPGVQPGRGVILVGADGTARRPGAARPEAAPPPGAAPAPEPADGGWPDPGAVIRKALRAAGLLS